LAPYRYSKTKRKENKLFSKKKRKETTTTENYTDEHKHNSFSIYNLRSPENKEIVQMSIFISVDGLEITVVDLEESNVVSFIQDSLHQATMI
jgi:hypothetical protein